MDNTPYGIVPNRDTMAFSQHATNNPPFTLHDLIARFRDSRQADTKKGHQQPTTSRLLIISSEEEKEYPLTCVVDPLAKFHQPSIMDVVRTQRKMARRTCSVPEDSPPPAPSKSPMRLFRRRRATSEPPPRRRRLIEDHFRVDKTNKVVLPGVHRYEEDWHRDAHDCFNLVILVPVIVLDVMNWNWDLMFTKGLAKAWTGEWFDLFFQVTACYFLVDLLWIASIPRCVKSPATIIQHHIATMIYILIPYYCPAYRWCMGACLSVELNTWFLIARRVLNKQGIPPWTIDLSFVSIRVKLISICFYITWIAIRCVLYPFLMKPFYDNWVDYSRKVGTRWNLVMLCLPLHAAFCLLNLHWSYALLMSKIRYWRRKGRGGEAVSKGL